METITILQLKIRIVDRASSALLHTGEWIERFGGRLAGSPGCRQTAKALRDELERACGNARIEAFSTHPSAFGRFYQVDALIYLVGLVLMLLDQPLPAALILTAMILGAGLEFGYYMELYDWLYPRVECHNVTAVLEPRGAATRQLIFSGHHDAAQELKFLKGSQKLYGLKILVPDCFRMLSAVVAWVWWVGLAATGSAPGFIGAAKILLIVGIYFVFTKFFLFTKNVTPGAGDNLIASAMLVELAEHFRDPLREGRSVLEHTRLVFASFDAEESGLRGSRAWVRAHRGELQALPTAALNIDSIYNLRDLQFLTTDLNSHVRLDKTLAESCVDAAHELGYPAATAVMRFGGGGTDAAELAKAGVHATTMIAMSTRLVRDGLVYHTMQDTVEAVEPQAVEACLAVAEKLAIELDDGSSVY
jgi:aminopeptidase YwaD